jgi:hypothetical protein
LVRKGTESLLDSPRVWDGLSRALPHAAAGKNFDNTIDQEVTMPKNNRSKNATLALVRKRERAERHEAMMAAHAKHREERNRALAAWEVAYEYWEATGKGPKPIHPDSVVVGIVNYGDDDLLRAAEELGIDLSGVGA